jgi:hypothetical protein
MEKLDHRRRLARAGSASVSARRPNTTGLITRLDVDSLVACVTAVPDGSLVAGDGLGRLHWLEIRGGGEFGGSGHHHQIQSLDHSMGLLASRELEFVQGFVS